MAKEFICERAGCLMRGPSASVHAMRVVSVNVGRPRTVRWKGRDVRTGIHKTPVGGRVAVRRLNLDGDQQADLSVHGGASKAVYAYPLEHYAYWQEELGEKLPFGAFGENLTVEGLPLEHEVAIGDRLRVGTRGARRDAAAAALLQARAPLRSRGDGQAVLLSGRTGCYLAVASEGELGAGDAVETVARHPARIPVAEITRVYASDRDDLATTRAAHRPRCATRTIGGATSRSGSRLRDALTQSTQHRGKEHEMHAHDKPASFHSSPQEALQAPPEEFLYLACLHEGTGVEQPDFLAVVDAEAGRIVHETPMPNVGDELHHFGWNRCSSACHGPDRSHLIVPGFRSSRIHILNVADDPRRPRVEKVIEPEELVAKTGYTRPHTVHCMPGGNVVVSMLGDADGNGACGFAVLDATDVRAEGPLGERRRDAAAQLRLLVPAAQERAPLLRVRRAERLRDRGSTSTDVEAGRYGHRLHFWNLAERKLEQTVDLGESGLLPFEVRWLHDPEAERGLRRRRAFEHDVALLPRQRRLGRRPSDRRRAASSSKAGRSRCPA